MLRRVKEGCSALFRPVLEDGSLMCKWSVVSVDQSSWQHLPGLLMSLATAKVVNLGAMFAYS